MPGKKENLKKDQAASMNGSKGDINQTVSNEDGNTKDIYQNKTNQLQFLAQSAIELVELNSIKEVYDYTAEKLYQLVDRKAIITIADYNTESNKWKLSTYKGLDKVDKVSSLLGYNFGELTGETDTAYYNQLERGKLVELEFNIPALTKNKLSKYLEKQVKQILLLDKLYCITFNRSNKIFGNVSIMPRKGHSNINKALIEAFIGQVSIFVDKLTAKQKLIEKEKKYKAVFETSPAGICITDLYNTLIDANKRFYEISGYTEQELIGKNLKDMGIFPVEHDSYAFWPYDKNNKPLCNFETSIRTRTSDIKTVLLSTNEITIDEDPNILTIITDITTFTQHKRKIHQLESRHKTIVNHQPDGAIFLFDKEKYFVTMAGDALSFIGKNNIDNTQNSIEEIFPEKFHRDIYALCQRILNGNKTQLTIEIEEKYFTVWGVPVLEDNNVINEGVIYFQNITKLKEKENELKDALKKAEESDKLKSAFLTNITHEVRTPMNGVLGFTELLKNSKPDDEEYYEYLDIIESSGKRMMTLINNLVELSMIQANEVITNKTEFNLNKLLDDVFHDFLEISKSKNLNFQLSKSLKDDDSIIYQDKIHLKKILDNLLNNAFKYTDKGTVRFGYQKSENYLEFFITDTGIGISETIKNKIFEYFRQADMNLKRRYEGAGLGLSISKAYINLLGGEMWIDSEPEKGSTFYFTIKNFDNALDHSNH